ncbi:nucleotidyltransferase/DNA polymerase for DNA repair [Fructobacillus pseudoficulneus]|uniref:Nucleotidyltransferase/DNA polymerase for DNA repair n=1 Tax=Fructobacillus pseudoficulneus TaxID=220714 RepID=A0A3F3GQT9_9LACO|nr:Y-family DNA polymerase [Fructobacillus pseudoficulneus]GAP02144.1 nucleotidyltransferase/DNA polymerase for DNA repair [Fructobacillus pseudoficulneus]SEH35882.1 DNA polymerase V [Fructobacillus pseudoficulneus]
MAKLPAPYQSEQRRVIFLIDSKSFYASVECVERNLNPLQAMLVVMSHQENDTGGLVLASSPMAKKRLGISNVTRQKDVPDVPGLIKAEPRMNLYIQKNLAINAIYQQYVDDDHLLPYSIDESILDMTDFWHLVADSPAAAARKIQEQVRREMGIYLSVGIGDSPALAKLALDLEGKKAPNLLAVWHYEDVAKKLWPISNLSQVWSIGKKTAAKLERWGIQTMGDLAHANPYQLKERLGLMGEQLFALAWGIDRTDLTEKIQVKDKSYGNSQVLPDTYYDGQKIQVVIQEMADQVASRLRSHGQQASLASLYLGYANQGIQFDTRHDNKTGLHQTVRIEPTNRTQTLMAIMNQIFQKHWTGQPVRYIGVSFAGLQSEKVQAISLFDPVPEAVAEEDPVDAVVDQIRHRFGPASLVRSLSLEKGATAIARANLVGGHNGGNTYE